ncbi:hypothetical protein Pcinc_011763, partial [Petrolisthes cinctipes]
TYIIFESVAPVCGSQERTQHSVAKRENAEVSCRVDANPPVVTFRWTFNNTAEAINVPEGRFVVVGTESRVNYTPMNELDYGTLLCWANNSVGIQAQPCVFHILPAGKPDPPHNCRVVEVTMSSLQLTCLPGGNGGLNQSFLLQMYPLGSRQPAVEMTRPNPTFSVTRLRPATTYLVRVAGVNHRGASRPSQLQVVTSTVLSQPQETSAEPTRERGGGATLPIRMGVMAAVIGGALVLVVTVTVLTLFIIRRRCHHRHPCSPPPPHLSPKSLSALSKEEETSATPLPSSCSPHHDPDLLSHTPASSTCTLHMSQSFFTPPTTTVSLLFIHFFVQYRSLERAIDSEYTQVLCPTTKDTHEQQPTHVQDNMGRSHHNSLTTPLTYTHPHLARDHSVPYLPESEQSKVTVKAIADCGSAERCPGHLYPCFHPPLPIPSYGSSSPRPSLQLSSHHPSDPSLHSSDPSLHAPDLSLHTSPPYHLPADPTLSLPRSLHPATISTLHSSLHSVVPPSFIRKLPRYSSPQCQCPESNKPSPSSYSSLTRQSKVLKKGTGSGRASCSGRPEKQEQPVNILNTIKMESSV